MLHHENYEKKFYADINTDGSIEYSAALSYCEYQIQELN